jgi:hypothetical protein
MLQWGFAKPDHHWREEDAEATRPASIVDDPWDPMPKPATVPESVPAETAAEDWSFDHGWSIVEPVQAAAPMDPAADLLLDLDLPEFNPQARQEIWEKSLSDPSLAAFAD